MTITINSQGRRHYLRGNTYPIKDRLRSAGCKWDPDAKCWYTGKRELALQLLAELAPESMVERDANLEGRGDAAAAIRALAPAAPERNERQAPGDDAIVAARATYKGKTYYVAGRVERGRTRWDDSVRAVATRDGAKVLLYSRDGKLQFWAPVAQIVGNVIRVGEPLPLSDGAQITKSYDRPQTIGKLRRFAEEAKQARAQGNADGIPDGSRYECEECGEYVTRGQGACWETGHAH